MAVPRLTSREAVLQAIAEFDRLGGQEFRSKYRFGSAREYFLVVDGYLYDSKAIAGVAHGYEHPDEGPLKYKQFVGGMGIKRQMERLGFEVRVLPAGSRPSNFAEGRPKTDDWQLSEGESLLRTELHNRYGGRRQGGISPSRSSPNVMLFSDPATGEKHGYFDGWQEDGCFHYTGEGQRGDQRMVQGNAQVLHHVEHGRSLRLFDGSSREVTYLGEFSLDAQAPWYETDAPETDEGPIRKVIVFRLRPISTAPQPAASPLSSLPPQGTIDQVPVEGHNSERAFVNPSQETYETERRESGLVQDFKAFLESHGRVVSRLRIIPPGEAKPLFSDLLDQESDVLVEAKGSVARQAVRMAIGQLADYSRFCHDEVKKAVLVPEEPRPDLMRLLDAESIIVVWPGEVGYESTASWWG